jgi:hypothetical protein
MAMIEVKADGLEASFEALQRIDMLLCPVVEGDPITAPPSSPPVGSCYLVAIGATGSWAGKDGLLATMTDGGWRFIAPVEGMRVFDRVSGQMVVRRAGAWERGVARAVEYRVNDQAVIRQRQPAIGDPAGGSVVDIQCRAAVASLLAAARAHGLIA